MMHHALLNKITSINIFFLNMLLEYIWKMCIGGLIYFDLWHFPVFIGHTSTEIKRVMLNMFSSIADKL